MTSCFTFLNDVIVLRWICAVFFESTFAGNSSRSARCEPEPARRSFVWGGVMGGKGWGGWGVLDRLLCRNLGSSAWTLHFVCLVRVRVHRRAGPATMCSARLFGDAIVTICRPKNGKGCILLNAVFPKHKFASNLLLLGVQDFCGIKFSETLQITFLSKRWKFLPNEYNRFSFVAYNSGKHHNRFIHCKTRVIILNLTTEIKCL